MNLENFWEVNKCHKIIRGYMKKKKEVKEQTVEVLSILKLKCDLKLFKFYMW